ncbi:MAG: c-type cytochrome [Gemmobacter sp.]
MTLRNLIPALAVVAAACLGQAAADEIGDRARGKDLFRTQCASCHQIGPEAKNRIGPPLNGVFGRRAGTVGGFAYSKSILRMGNDGLAWTLETLDAYVENPKALVSGTRMNFRGLKDRDDRLAVLAYLRDYSDSPRDIPEAEPTALRSVPNVPPEVLAIKGDVEFGEYLSSECTTCHQRDGSDQGIPAITQWPDEDFVVAMHAYKQKLRPHPVMQMMAGRLSDDEIAALAAYFATLE